MKHQVEIISNGDELVILGKKSDVRKFVKEAGVLDLSLELDSGRLAKFLGRVVQGLDVASKISETSVRWLKLTDDSARKIKQFGLMESAKHGKNVVHVMAGAPGKISGWLQAEVGGGNIFSNPAVLNGLSNYLSQQTLQLEQKQIQDMLKRIDSKLDDLHEKQLNEQLAKLDSVLACVQDAQTKSLHNDGIVNSVTWSQLDNQGAVLAELQAYAFRELQSHKEKAKGLTKIGAAARELKEIEKGAAVWLQVLGKTMELRTQLAQLELAAVESIHPNHLVNHAKGVRAALEQGRIQVGDFLISFLREISATTSIATANLILHKPAAEKIVRSISRVESKVVKFAEALELTPPEITVPEISWRQAIKNPEQWKTAGKEAALNAGKAVLAVGTAVGVKELLKFLKK
jgi:hypothetical protein